MAVSVVSMRRCEHIRTNGTQCGSPAQREKKMCYQHLRGRPERVKVRGGDGKTSEIVVPLLEDAHSIQTMVREAMVLMLRGRIEGEMAGRLLYALQIASANLGRMREEAPRPVQVVVDVERVGETPLGMRRGQGSRADTKRRRWKTRWWRARSGRFWRKRRTKGGRRRIGA